MKRRVNCKKQLILYVSGIHFKPCLNFWRIEMYTRNGGHVHGPADHPKGRGRERDHRLQLHTESLWHWRTRHWMVSGQSRYHSERSDGKKQNETNAKLTKKCSVNDIQGLKSRIVMFVLSNVCPTWVYVCVCVHGFFFLIACGDVLNQSNFPIISKKMERSAGSGDLLCTYTGDKLE